MGITNENNLIVNQICTVSYTGRFFEDNSNEVSIVYGFGDNWENTSEMSMTKTENGFIAEIKMLNYDKFNFCFRNSNNEWDNNNYANYSLPIKLETSPETNSIVAEQTSKDNILNDILEESNFQLDYIQEFNIDKLIDELLSPLLVENVFESEENDAILNENITNILNQELYSSQPENIVSFKSESTETIDDIYSDLKQLVDSVESNLSTTSSKIQNDIFNEDIFSNPATAETALALTNGDKFIVCTRKLSKFYLIRKKIKLALYKLIFAVPRMLNKELNTNK